MQRVDSVYYFIPSRNKKVFADDKVNFLISCSGAWVCSRVVENKIFIFRVADDKRVVRWRYNLISNALVYCKFFHHAIKFSASRRFKIYPDYFSPGVASNHPLIVYAYTFASRFVWWIDYRR